MGCCCGQSQPMSLPMMMPRPYNNCICSLPALIILILVVLQFSRRSSCCCDGDGSY